MLLVPLAWFLYAYEEMLFVDVTFIHYSFHLGYTLATETKSFKRHESIIDLLGDLELVLCVCLKCFLQLYCCENDV